MSRRIEALSSTPVWLVTAYGFRDWCCGQGYPRGLVEQVLASFIQNNVESAYHRTDLLDQQRPMMDAWAEFVGSGLTGA